MRKGTVCKKCLVLNMALTTGVLVFNLFFSRILEKPCYTQGNFHLRAK